jgi:hypothetical protein
VPPSSIHSESDRLIIDGVELVTVLVDRVTCLKREWNVSGGISSEAFLQNLVLELV